MTTLSITTADLRGKRLLVRTDPDLPIEDGGLTVLTQRGLVVPVATAKAA
jgi:3-phosphoglycerate kinase